MSWRNKLVRKFPVVSRILLCWNILFSLENWIMCEVVPQYVWKREISPLPVNRKTTDEAEADEEDNSEVCCILHG